MTLSKIISGGQTGADRAALDWAIFHGIPHGGYCPKGRTAEDGRIPERFNLIELETTSYPARTKRNVEDADATIIFTSTSELTKGSRLTAKFAAELGKPCLHIWAELPRAITVETIRDFLEEHQPEVVNIAGSRASTDPKIGHFVNQTLTFLVATQPPEKSLWLGDGDPLPEGWVAPQAAPKTIAREAALLRMLCPELSTNQSYKAATLMIEECRRLGRRLERPEIERVLAGCQET